VLLTDNDVFVGAPDELQLAFLDSAAPEWTFSRASSAFVASTPRAMQQTPTVSITGVLSDLLPVGSAFAMLGVAETQSFIDESLTNPCKGVPNDRFCWATTVIRCVGERPAPVVTLEECADAGLVCAAVGGVAECGAATPEG
jgi:hypothetical protein